MNRICGKCKKNKIEKEYMGYCYSCKREYDVRWNEQNKEKKMKTIRRLRDERKILNRKLICDYLIDHPCTDCNEKNIIVLEFDHLRDKEYPIPIGLRDRTWKTVLKEIEKCEVVCANCHRIREAERGNTSRYLFTKNREKFIKETKQKITSPKFLREFDI